MCTRNFSNPPPPLVLKKQFREGEFRWFQPPSPLIRSCARPCIFRMLSCRELIPCLLVVLTCVSWPTSEAGLESIPGKFNSSMKQKGEIVLFWYRCCIIPIEIKAIGKVAGITKNLNPRSVQNSSFWVGLKNLNWVLSY